MEIIVQHKFTAQTQSEVVGFNFMYNLYKSSLRNGYLVFNLYRRHITVEAFIWNGSNERRNRSIFVNKEKEAMSMLPTVVFPAGQFSE